MYSTESARCDFCKSDNSRVVYSEGALKLVECNICGFNYVNPRIRTGELLRHYDEDCALGTEEARRKLKDAPPEQQVVTDQTRWSVRQWEMYRRWLDDDLRRIMKLKKSGRLLDIGFSDGLRLEIAYEHGWRDIYGIELSDAAIEKVKARFGFKDSADRFRNATITDCRFPEGFFDVITYWSVLEHVVDPLENLRTAYRLLKKGGIIVIRVPNVAEEFLRKYQVNLIKFLFPRFIKKLAGMKDLRPIAARDVFDLSRNPTGAIGGLDLELHLNHFNDRTLSMFLKKCGFRVLENGNGEVPLCLHEINLKTITQAATRFFLNLPYYLTFYRKFNFWQQLFFIAEK